MFPHKSTRTSDRDVQWMTLAHAHHPLLHRHCLLVSHLCAAFSAFLKQSVAEQKILARAGLLHDIGKLRIPVAILQKPSLLTDEELELVQSHGLAGYKMLLESGETDETLLTVARDHHERLDGSGYPRKLKAEVIPTSVRMVTLCDVFAAMTEPRPYAEAMSWDEALERMAMKRTRLDLDLLSTFTTMVSAMNTPKKPFRLSQIFKRRAS